MHSIIDDFAWVVIGLVVVAFLFVLGTAYIFLDEGIRYLVRRIRKPAGVAGPRLASQATKSEPVRFSATGIPSQPPQGPHPPLVNPHHATSPTIWRRLRAKVREIKSRTLLRLHLRHHKPANVKL
ncbi:MAG: hypothetical protein P8Z30_19345 [Acidobacteriota bacterium]